MLKRKTKGFKPHNAATSSGSSNGSTVAGSDAPQKSSSGFRSLLAKFGGGGSAHSRLSVSTHNLTATSLENLPGRGGVTSSSTLPSTLGTNRRHGNDLEASPAAPATTHGSGMEHSTLLERRRAKAMSLQHLPSEPSCIGGLESADGGVHRTHAAAAAISPQLSPPPDTKSLLSVASTATTSRAVSMREVLVECLVGAKRIQACSDLFLLSGDRLHTPNLGHLNSDRQLGRAEDCLEELLSRLRVFPILVGSLQATLASDSSGVQPMRLSDPRECVQRFVSALDILCELTSACVFALSSRCPGWVAPRPGLIEQRAVLSAADDVDLCCHRLRHASEHSCDEEHEMLASACERLARCLTFFAAASRIAAGAATEEAEMFVLAVRALTANATCLLECVRRYCAAPSDERRARMAAFANALGAAVHALVTMVTDERFAGQPATAPPQTKAMRTKLFGACLNLSSASIQFLHSIADQYGNRTATLHRRSLLCSEAISEAVNHFLGVITSMQTAPPSPR